ncbi:MAG: hypothetical protein H6569_10060 [Lewinellaceae bacterium]|nr:hypothetical protein [Lewinellaceae bacterium]
MDTWEDGLEFQDVAPRTSSPLEELREWLDTDKPELSPWEIDEQADQWGELMDDEESLTWLFFYDQHRNQDPEEATEEQPSPEDYEDFDWHSEEDEFGDLPF